jgi:hypothetical protein
MKSQAVKKKRCTFCGAEGLPLIAHGSMLSCPSCEDKQEKFNHMMDDIHGSKRAYARHPLLAEKIMAAPVELELKTDIHALLQWFSEECDIPFDSLCSQLVEEGLQKFLDNREELGKLMSGSLKQSFSLHRWLQKDEW